MILASELLLDIDDIANFNFGGVGPGDYVNDTELFLGGSGAIKCTCTPAETVVIKENALSIDLTKYHSVTLWYFAHENMTLDSALVVDFITDASGKTNFYSTKTQQSTTNITFNTSIGKGWNAWTVAIDDLVQTASGDLADIKQIFITVDCTVNTNVWTIDSIYAHQYAKPKLCFIFDDINESDLTEAYDYMYTQQEAIKAGTGIVGSSSLYSTGVDAANRLTLANCLAMKSDGWCFVNHSNDNTELDTVTTAEALAKLAICRDYIKNNGLETNGSASMAVFPGGNYTSDLIDAMNTYNFGRIATQKNAPNQFILHPSDESAQSINPRLCSLSAVLDASFVIATFRAQMEDLTKYGGVGFIMVHGIVASGATGIQTNQADFRAAVDHAILLQQRGLIDILTVEQAINV